MKPHRHDPDSIEVHVPPWSITKPRRHTRLAVAGVVVALMTMLTVMMTA